GPAAARTVDDLTERVRRWDRVRKSVIGVRVDVHPAGQGDVANALLTVDKRFSRVVVTLEEEQGT
ncbi:MAG TPA: hypothetical protein VFX70_06070, partial [Mycobacteriales bacterium]|nr:hypothetical protein [Mycobacteriales bacterium]